jgi:hypothetical protein
MMQTSFSLTLKITQPIGTAQTSSSLASIWARENEIANEIADPIDETTTVVSRQEGMGLNPAGVESRELSALQCLRRDNGAVFTVAALSGVRRDE